MIDTLYVVLWLVTWAVCTIAATTWARSQIKIGKPLPIRLWWLESLVSYLTHR